MVMQAKRQRGVVGEYVIFVSIFLYIHICVDAAHVHPGRDGQHHGHTRHKIDGDAGQAAAWCCWGVRLFYYFILSIFVFLLMRRTAPTTLLPPSISFRHKIDGDAGQAAAWRGGRVSLFYYFILSIFVFLLMRRTAPTTLLPPSILFRHKIDGDAGQAAAWRGGRVRLFYYFIFSIFIFLLMMGTAPHYPSSSHPHPSKEIQRKRKDRKKNN